MISDLITFKDSKSRVAEAYRTLRTNIQFLSLEKDLKSIVVTSSKPLEGKSTVTLNLAVTMAETGKKVVIVDCDFRRPVIHKKLDLSNDNGLTNILLEDIELSECINKLDVENLYAITSGTIPPNPAELLSSNKMKDLLNQLEEQFDIVLIDVPPVLFVTDAQILASIADGVILVVAYGKTDKKSIVKAKELLNKVGASINGVVMNKIPKKSRKYYGKYSYYGSTNKKEKIKEKKKEKVNNLNL